MGTTTDAIRVEDLTRHFGAVRALEGLTLTVPAGIVFGFLGTNGAGKTTTIRLLLGLLDATRGHAQVLGYDTRGQAAAIRLQTGALLEHPGLYERLSAEDNLDFYGRIWGMSAADRRARIKELLSQLGLWERRRERAGAWSRGMKQKLAVARALLHRPRLVFLDEPTSGLDPVSAAALRDDLGHLSRSEGTTVFLTTHNLAEAERLCPLVGVVRQGTLLAVGHPDELRARVGGPRAEIVGRNFSTDLMTLLRARPEVASVEPANGRLLIDLSSDAPLAPMVRLAVEQGADVEEVRRGAASLEDAFLALVEGGDV